MKLRRSRFRRASSPKSWNAEFGTGDAEKSHLAQAIGQAVILQDYKVLYREGHVLLDERGDAVAEGGRKEYMEDIATVPFLIKDDFGSRELPYTEAKDLLEYRHGEITNVPGCC